MFYQPIPHTAGIGFKTWGGTLEELFANAASALMDCMVEVVKATADKTVFVQLTAENLEELLLKWLSEVLYHFETDSLIGFDFNITRCDFDNFRATIHGIDWNPKQQPLKTEIKAVAFHKIKIEKKNDRYEVEILLDV